MCCLMLLRKLLLRSFRDCKYFASLELSLLSLSLLPVDGDAASTADGIFADPNIDPDSVGGFAEPNRDADSEEGFVDPNNEAGPESDFLVKPAKPLKTDGLSP